jgi:xanthosine utilization system XapX-like protein
MLTQYGGFPAFDLMYDTGGHLVDPTAETDALTYFGSGAGIGVSDIILISHGWNNDIDEARTLYTNFFNAFAAVPSALRTKGGRTFGIFAIFWPSKKFVDSSLIPGGAAGVADPAATRVMAQLNQFEDLFSSDPAVDGKIAHLKSLVPILNFSANAQDDYVSTLASMVPKPRYETDEGLDNARSALSTMPGHIVLANLAAPVGPTSPPLPGSGGAAGLLSGITSAAASLGDLLTYYTMKDRAGIVGRTGVVGTIRSLLKCRSPGAPPKIHLVGHSFGGRLVTAAANTLNGSAVSAPETVDSMMLLEAAYSHNGMASNWDGKGGDGAFRSVIAQVKVKGPIIISHSSHDFPVGIAYPLASRLRGQVADALIGGANDIYGGMGRNGAQHTPEVLSDVPLSKVDGTAVYPPAPASPCWVLNICGDGPPPAPTITSHGDVAKPELIATLLNYI